MSGGNWKEMFRAACEGDLSLVEYHVRDGIDVNYVHPEILGTALVGSILAQQEACALYLLENGANPNLLSEFEGLVPIEAARQAGLKSVEEKLLELGATPALAPAESAESASARSTPGGWLSRLWSGRK